LSRRRRDPDPDFRVAVGSRRQSRRRLHPIVPTEQQPRFIRKLKTFTDRWNTEFPDTPCVECGTLLLPRHRQSRAFRQDHIYGISKVFGVPVSGESGAVVLCKECVSSPRPPVDCGKPPPCILALPQRSRKFLSPFKLNVNLGRTTGYNTSAIPFTYRTLTGKVVVNTQNKEAIALYSGCLGAWLEANRDNKWYQGHNQELLSASRDWLLANNAVFQRNDVRAHLQVDVPLPLVHLADDNPEELRPQTRPDFVMNPFQYDPHTRNEDFRYDRLTVGAVLPGLFQEQPPALYRSDPDVEALCFPHLYPYGRGQYKKRLYSGDEVLGCTRYQDTKHKLCSLNSSFRDDWYWPSWAYSEIEATRIFQNNMRLINNKNRQALDNRLPHHHLLQQSSYGQHSIINETITHTIPASIRTGEAFFQGKERLVNSVLAGRGLPHLFITTTFNENWIEFQKILERTPTKLASNHPWEGVQFYYERIHNLKNKFWKSPAAKFGKLKELIERFEFQLRGAIHSHCLLWTQKSVADMLAENHIRADIPDPEKEPRLYDLVIRYQIHVCKPHICGGVGKYGQCRKGFPAKVSPTTYHEPGSLRYTYKRTEKDVWVSPYNAELLLIWEGHINVQYCTDEGVAAYITKYVTKGEPISHLSLKDDSALERHLLGRRIGSMEMMVLALGLDIFRSTSGTLFLPTAVPEMRNYAVRSPQEIEENPDDPYFPYMIEKYFARPVQYEDLTYFQYFQKCTVVKTPTQNKDGVRDGDQDALGYWVYRRRKPSLVRSEYRRLCDGESFFFQQLLFYCHWRSDREILGASQSYRDRLLTILPDLYQRVIAGQEETATTAALAVGREYLEMVQRIAQSTPVNVNLMVSTQLRQLNAMKLSSLDDGATLALQGDQYNSYTIITRTIQSSRYTGSSFFVTGPGGTGKSFLLNALKHWCLTSHQRFVLLAPTGIAARNIDGNTIHSALSITCDFGTFKTSLFDFSGERLDELKKLNVIFIDEVSMVDGELLDFISYVFAKIKENNLPFGNLHVVLLGDLMQLPPVTGLKVWHAQVWSIFNPLFLRQPQRQKDLKFFNVLNKIRLGIVDDEVRATLTARWQAYNPALDLWTTTFLSSLRDESKVLNDTVLQGMPPENLTWISYAEDFENGVKIDTSEKSTIFKRGTNFAAKVVCKVGAKVMFLTNSMLKDKGISNGSIGVITEVTEEGFIEGAFPTKDGIQVKIPITKFLHLLCCAYWQWLRYFNFIRHRHTSNLLAPDIFGSSFQ
jgi:hypothetical protein